MSKKSSSCQWTCASWTCRPLISYQWAPRANERPQLKKTCECQQGNLGIWTGVSMQESRRWEAKSWQTQKWLTVVFVWETFQPASVNSTQEDNNQHIQPWTKSTVYAVQNQGENHTPSMWNCEWTSLHGVITAQTRAITLAGTITSSSRSRNTKQHAALAVQPCRSGNWPAFLR